MKPDQFNPPPLGEVAARRAQPVPAKAESGGGGEGQVCCSTDPLRLAARATSPGGGGFASNLVRVALAALLAIPLTGCSGILDPKGPVGASEKLVLFDALAIMLVIVVPTIIAIFACAWWFRAGNGRANYRPEWDFSGKLELIVWSIPALVITFLGGIAWFGSHTLDPYAPLPSKQKPIEVQVVSLDWKWLFIYPAEHIATVNQLVIPVGVPVHFSLTSSGVMNSFFVPQLGSQIYTMAAMTSQVSLQADQPGVFTGMSAQFSGAGFAGMHFTVKAVPPAAYTSWLAATKTNGPALDNRSYATLAMPSKDVAPTTYKTVDPALFNAIVAGKPL